MNKYIGMKYFCFYDCYLCSKDCSGVKQVIVEHESTGLLLKRNHEMIQILVADMIGRSGNILA
jgi:hypothetical protein